MGDSPSIAHNLRNAFAGFPKHPKFEAGGKQLVHKFSSLNNGDYPAQGDPFWMSRKSLQKETYKELLNCTFQIDTKDHLEDLFMQRVSRMFSSYAIDFDTQVIPSECLGALRGLSPSLVVKVLKTWLNGWVTSYRMTEPVLHNCLLGCRDCPDNLDHYLQCKHIFALTSFLIPATSSEPLVRFGLMQPCKEQCKVVACIFSSYHAVKRSIRESQFAGGGQNIDYSCGAALRYTWTLFA
jgi:hypothetical protein